MEKVREKYDVLLQDAGIALMQRRNEWKANILKAYANMLLTEVWKIDLKAVSSGTRKGTISETSCKFFISFCVHAAWVCLGDLSL
uniref:Uncharacterized protein n=1 Tax=Rhizophora mucronata TaxID=61149 RepID=A0A2P2ISK9_RHIMU